MQKQQSSTATNMVLLDDTAVTATTSIFQSTSTFLSTISADIDNIPQDEFGKVFAGGIVVMIGGVFSALMVGFLLESGNSYASVVADSYAQGGDEEFWDSLSPEDQVKARELIAKLKASKGESVEDINIGAAAVTGSGVIVEDGNGNSSSDVTGKKSSEVDAGKQKQSEKKADAAVSMFSDYD